MAPNRLECGLFFFLQFRQTSLHGRYLCAGRVNLVPKEFGLVCCRKRGIRWGTSGPPPAHSAHEPPSKAAAPEPATTASSESSECARARHAGSGTQASAPSCPGTLAPWSCSIKSRHYATPFLLPLGSASETHASACASAASLAHAPSRHQVAGFTNSALSESNEQFRDVSGKPRNEVDSLQPYQLFQSTTDPAANNRVHAEFLEPRRAGMSRYGRPVFGRNELFLIAGNSEDQKPPACVKDRSNTALMFGNCHLHRFGPAPWGEQIPCQTAKCAATISPRGRYHGVLCATGPLVSMWHMGQMGCWLHLQLRPMIAICICLASAIRNLLIPRTKPVIFLDHARGPSGGRQE